MGKTVVIHQPDFLPYLGFFERLLHCDIYVVLDHVQYIKGGWQNRDKIKTPEGVKWLTLPLQIKGKTFCPYNEVLVSKNTNWQEQHLSILKRCYNNALYFREIYETIEPVYSQPCDRMVEFNYRLLSVLMDLFDVHPEILFSSELNPPGKSNEMLVNILEMTGAGTYLSGVGAKDYLIERFFSDAGIKLTWQSFTVMPYPQLFGDFVPYLSCVDLLFNCGIDKSRDLLRGYK